MEFQLWVVFYLGDFQSKDGFTRKQMKFNFKAAQDLSRAVDLNLYPQFCLHCREGFGIHKAWNCFLIESIFSHLWKDSLKYFLN